MAVATKNVGALAVEALFASSITPVLPTVSAGDLMVALVFFVSFSSPTISAPAGWQQAGTAVTGGLARASCFYKIAGGSESDPTFTFSGSGPAHARIVTFSGTDQTNPVGALGPVTAGSGNPHTSSEITPTDNGLVFYWDIGRANTALDQPSGWVEWFDSGGTNSQSSGGTKAASAGVGSGNISVNGGANAWAQQQIEILPPSPFGAGSAAGSSTATAVSAADASGAGSATGSATAAAVSAAGSAGVGSASGSSTAVAVGTTTGGPAAIVAVPDQPLVFSDAAAAILAGQRVVVALGVKMELASETLHLWLGNGMIRSNDGQQWEGLGRLGGVSGLEFGALAATQPINLTLSGLDVNLAAAARAQYSEMRGRRVSIYTLVFDENMQPVDLPYLCMLATIDNASLRRVGDVFTLDVTAEPIFNTKHMPALNLVTDADQQARYPGDRIFDRAAYPHSLYWQQ